MSLTEPEIINRAYKGIFIILLATTITVGMNAYLFTVNKQSKLTTTDTPPTIDSSLPSYTSAEVATHTITTDCWIIAYGQVYDITSYIESQSHPGGQESLTSACGQDVTDSFDRIHSPQTKAGLDKLHIGSLTN